jgi:hypothetical protein
VFHHTLEGLQTGSRRRGCTHDARAARCGVVVIVAEIPKIVRPIPRPQRRQIGNPPRSMRGSLPASATMRRAIEGAAALGGDRRQEEAATEPRFATGRSAGPGSAGSYSQVWLTSRTSVSCWLHPTRRRFDGYPQCPILA